MINDLIKEFRDQVAKRDVLKTVKNYKDKITQLDFNLVRGVAICKNNEDKLKLNREDYESLLELCELVNNVWQQKSKKEIKVWPTTGSKLGSASSSGSAEEPVMGREELAKWRSDRGKELYKVEPPKRPGEEEAQQGVPQTTMPVPESTYSEAQNTQYQSPHYYQSAIPIPPLQSPPQQPPGSTQPQETFQAPQYYTTTPPQVPSTRQYGSEHQVPYQQDQYYTTTAPQVSSTGQYGNEYQEEPRAESERSAGKHWKEKNKEKYKETRKGRKDPQKEYAPRRTLF